MKLIYVGMQRCGTKSFGDFFRKQGMRIFSWAEIERHELGRLWFEGRWQEILNSGIFQDYDVFEDGPFQDPAFSRFLSHSVAGSRFVYFHRPPSDWYKSMVTHSKGLTLGDVGRHCYTYDRLEDLHFLREELGAGVKKLSLVGMKEHYERIYSRHHRQILERFSTIEPSRFYVDELYNAEKFMRLCQHFGMAAGAAEDQHSHRSSVSFADVLRAQKYLV